MADIEHVALLKQGMDVWNTWRDENPDILPDLMYADLSSANLIGVDLIGVDLSGANLRGANLRGTNLNYADLSSANLIDADLRGTDLIQADLSSANLSSASLYNANLYNANLNNANLRSASLIDANLNKANLIDASLIIADLRSADLRGAELRGALLNDANLSDTKLRNADLRRAALIDTQLDRADLTGARLWETQRSGWSIKDVTCQRAFWDRNSIEPTEYEDGTFERIFSEKPHIILRYAGGMSPVDLAMLPLIIERLQAEHPNSSLHIRSVQDDGSGATVTITVEDLADRSHEVFAQEVEAMRGDLATLQRRLQQEEWLRLKFEAKYQALIEDVLPLMVEGLQPKTKVHVGQITAPTIIGSTTMNGDTNINQGQAAIVGRDGHAHGMTFQQVWNQSGIDLPMLAKELGQLRAAMKEAEGKDDQDEEIGAVAAAEKAAIKGDGPTTLQHLKSASKWTLGVAEKIGVPLAVEAMKRMM